jgi:glycosyltransferase involved in cell wall biosynthesis
LDPLPYRGRWLRSKEACKEALGFPASAKIVLRTDRHVPRKFYHTLLRTMGEVFDADPDVMLLIHCRPQDEGGNMLEEIARLPVKHWSRVKLTQAHDTWKGLPTSELVVLHNAADLYVSTTSGEGFGLTLAESLACEVPVVVTDWAADAETIGPGGIAVPPLHDAYGEPVTYHSTYGMDWAVPDARAFVQPVLDLLAKPQRRRAMGQAGRRHVVASFQWPDAADRFMSLFASAVPEEAAA